MYSPDFEKRILKYCSPTARNLYNKLDSEASSSLDRFIPCRWVRQLKILLNCNKFLFFSFCEFYFCSANNNWQTNFASIAKSNENSPQSNKKQRDIGESARDSLAYSCLLKNELLGTAIDDVKSVSDDRNENIVAPSAKRGLFKYQTPSKQVSTKVILFIKKNKIYNSKSNYTFVFVF